MPWWPFGEPTQPPPDPTPEPDHGSIYCSCCPEHRGRWLFNGVLLCAVCDNPAPPHTEG